MTNPSLAFEPVIKQADKRGFAGTTFANQTNVFPFIDSEGERANNPFSIETGGQAMEIKA